MTGNRVLNATAGLLVLALRAVGVWPLALPAGKLPVFGTCAGSAGCYLETALLFAEGPLSTQQEFIDELLKVLGTHGSIIVYNIGFEKTRLRELKEEFPHLESVISAVQERLVDLMAPFRRNYRLPEMQGSRSLKNVLPALVHELNYELLDNQQWRRCQYSFL